MHKLHHKSKRYEVQVYSEVKLAWEPVAHTDSPAVAIEKVQSINVKGDKARVLDRVCRAVVITANQIKNDDTNTHTKGDGE